MYDVIIIGAGVTGCSIARELSKYQLKILVVEQFDDLCEGTSKANSGIIHAGFDAKLGTWKSKLNIIGSNKMEELSKELEIPFYRNGALVIANRTEELNTLMKLKEQGIKAGVPYLKLLDKQSVNDLEPNTSNNVQGALLAPSSGIICPFSLTIALAENSYVNGVEFLFNTTVTSIIKSINTNQVEHNQPHTKSELHQNYEKMEKHSLVSYILKTNNGNYSTKVVVNAAGIYADVLNNMISENKIKIIPRKGEYLLFDKDAGLKVTKTIFQTPGRMGKGLLVTPTVHGNLLVGPNAMDVMDKTDVSTSKTGYEEIIEKAKLSIRQLPIRQMITSFSGLRAHEEKGDFVIGEAADAKGFINAAGIESPGLSCAPAIGRLIEDIIVNILHPVKKSVYIKERKGIPNIASLTDKEREELIKEDSTFANVICRCEMITEGEILAAIHRPLGAKTLDGIKRRTRAGMGRCQSGFCSPKLLKILSRELRMDITDVTKFGGNSTILFKTQTEGGSKHEEY